MLVAMREALAVVASIPEAEQGRVHSVAPPDRLQVRPATAAEGTGWPGDSTGRRRLAAPARRLQVLSTRGTSVYLQWVPGHAGLDGNEDADRLAGEAAVADQPDVPIDLVSARSAIGRRVGRMVDVRARASHPHPAPTPGHHDLSRWEACILSQLRTGTSPLTRDVVHRLGLAEDAACPACGKPDSAVHLLTECPAYEVARRRRWGFDPTLGDVLGGPAALVIEFIPAVGRIDPPVDPPAPPPPEKRVAGVVQEKKKELKVAFQTRIEYRLRLSILTLSPFGQKRTAEFFGTSLYMVKRSKVLKQTSGILPEVQSASKGRRIDGKEQAKVKAFYASDSVSRVCPGRKDCRLSVTRMGLKQRRRNSSCSVTCGNCIICTKRTKAIRN